MKPLDDLRQRIGGFPIDPVEWHRNLEDLFAVTHIDRAAHPRRPVKACPGPRSGGGSEASQAFRFHILEQELEGCAVKRARVTDVAARDLKAQIGRQHTPGRQHGRNTRHDDPLEVELAGNVGHVQSGGATKGEQGEVPGIDAAAHRDEPHSLGHRRIDDPVDAARGSSALGLGHAGDRSALRGRAQPHR